MKLNENLNIITSNIITRTGTSQKNGFPQVEVICRVRNPDCKNGLQKLLMWNCINEPDFDLHDFVITKISYFYQKILSSNTMPRLAILYLINLIIYFLNYNFF